MSNKFTDVDSLKKLQNVDINLKVRGMVEKEFQVEAILTKFQPIEGDPSANPRIVKKIEVSALGKSLEIAQNNALTLALDLLGEK